jgi:hypothetical protein
MLGRWRQAAWIAAFACIAFGFGYGFEIWRASQQTHVPQHGYHSAQSQKEDNPTNGKGEVHKSLWERTWEDPVAFFTLWIAIFTFVLAASTIGLWIATILTLSHSRETAERQLRAYVLGYLGHIRVAASWDGELALDGSVVLKNFGQTPASDFQSWVIIDLLDSNERPFDRIGNAVPGGVVAPTCEVTLPLRFGPISNDDIRAIEDGSKRIFVWGSAQYFDAFKQRRYFRFYNWNGDGHGQWGMVPSDRPHEAN